MELQSGDRLFEWDENKNRININKHGLSFKTAAKVFLDKNRKNYYDFEHSINEDRWITIGKVKNVLFVVYTERGDKTRIISAREAQSSEKEKYYGNGNIYIESK